MKKNKHKALLDRSQCIEMMRTLHAQGVPVSVIAQTFQTNNVSVTDRLKPLPDEEEKVYPPVSAQEVIMSRVAITVVDTYRQAVRRRLMAYCLMPEKTITIRVSQLDEILRTNI